jgi:hypothetical protein
MKKLLFLLLPMMFVLLTSESCEGERRPANVSALDEQAHTEQNQRKLNSVQPAPEISWSLERDNLIKRFKLQNDRSVVFFMYIFIEGVADPIGYYQVNKVSSVNSQLTNPMQVVHGGSSTYYWEEVLPSPAEDGSYGTNGDAVFGFTPEEIYIEHNLKYIAATVPLTFQRPVNRLAIINVKTAKELKEMMDRVNN